jgi:Disulphide bond corrector protein DsbC
MIEWSRLALAGALAFSACSSPALAKDVDPSTLYEVTTRGSTERLKVGEKGSFVLQISVKEGAHVSDEAPLKLELKGQNVRIEKLKLTLSDSVAKKAQGQTYANPRFEVPMTAEAAGKGGVDGKLTFFICTEQICARQQKTISVPVEVL